MAYEDERKEGGQVVKERCDNIDRRLSDTGQFIGALDRAIEDRPWMGRAS